MDHDLAVRSELLCKAVGDLLQQIQSICHSLTSRHILDDVYMVTLYNDTLQNATALFMIPS